MRIEDVFEYVRSEYPREVTPQEVAEYLSDDDTYVGSHRQQEYARNLLRRLARYGMVDNRREGKRTYYIWVPDVFRGLGA